MQVEENCNALWPQGQMVTPPSTHLILIITVWDAVAALDVQYKLTFKKEIQPSCIYGENAVDPCGQDSGNGGADSSSKCGKSYIFHPEGEYQELLFWDINSLWARNR